MAAIRSSFTRVATTVGQRLTRAERRTLGICATLLLVGALWALAIVARDRTELVPREGGAYREGAVGQPRYVTPVLAQTNDIDMALSRLIYSGLLTVSPEGQLVGDLAEDVTISDDGKVYTASLRKDVSWHDGEPFTADDVVFTVQSIQNPDTKSPLAPSFQGVAVEKVDAHAVTFTLREPYAPFLHTLTTGIIPRHVWESVEPRSMSLAEQNLKPIGTGPFRFTKLRKRSLGEVREYELARSDTTHGPRPYLDSMTFTFFQNTDELIRALRSRKIDGASAIQPSRVPDVERIPGIVVQRVKLPQYAAVFFNQARKGALGDGAVRAALNLAVDRDRLIRDALNGEGLRANAPIPPGFIGHVDGLGETEFNVEKARQNLEEAGWTDDDGDGIREKDDARLAFTLVTTDWPEYVTTANLLAEFWRAAGAEVSVEAISVGTVQTDAIRPRAYDALLYGQVLGPDPDPYAFWHSTQTRDPGLNLALYKDRESDKLLEEARKTTDAERRRELYERFQGRLTDSTPAIFLYSPLYAYAVRTAVRGEMLDALSLPAQRFATIPSWHMRTKRVWKQ